MSTETHPPIKPKTPFSMPLSGWVVLMAAVGAIFGGIAVEQYKIGIHENRIEKLEQKSEEANRLLYRIDEKLDYLQRQLENRSR